jgi:DNA ligase (NAD+)
MKNLVGGLEIVGRAARRVAELVTRLEAYRASYYAGTATVSDEIYDALEDELRALAPAHPALARVGTPAVSESWAKAQHEIPMGSLNKVTDAAEFGDWLARCDALLAKQDAPSIASSLFVTEKLDGISIELIYRDGVFSDGITRGDGHVGEQITANVTRMRGVPSRIADHGRISVRGEIIVRSSDMRAHFPDYANARNAAAGTSRRLDGQGSQHLTVVCYDMAREAGMWVDGMRPDGMRPAGASGNTAAEPATEIDKMQRLSNLGFATPNSFRGDADAVLGIYQRYSQELRAALDYEIDGLVVRADSLDAQALLGDVNRRPRGAVAFKFASPSKISTVVEIRWDTGPSGRVTPVAIVEPVELAGATVRRASLHNVAHVRSLGIAVGDEVLVSRRNDVIPYVEQVVTKHAEAIQPPQACAVCGVALEVVGEYLMCRNTGCAALVEGRIRNWIDAIGALEWGDKLVAALVASGKLREPGDLYALSVDDIASLERHGAKSAQNALDQLHGCSPLRLPTFLAALGIEGFSTQTARLLVAAGLGDLEAVLVAEEADLAAIPGLGEIKARQIVAGLRARNSEIERLLAAGVVPVSERDAGPLAGKSVCITGSHQRPRKVLAQLITGSGGQVSSGVTKDLDYLLIGDPESTSSKAQKARRYGTALIAEVQLLALIGDKA